MKLSDQEATQFAKIFEYGHAGNGKTVAAASFPGPLYFFDFDNGTKSIKTVFKDLFSTNRKKFEEITGKSDLQAFLDTVEFDRYFDPTPEEPKGYRAFEAKITEWQELLKKGKPFPYATVVIDSLTTLEMCLSNVIVKEVKSDRKFGGVFNMQDYGILIHFVDHLMPEVLALPCNLVMTAHVLIDTDKEGNEITYKPMVKGRWLPSKIPAWFDEVYYTSAKSSTEKVKEIKDGKAIETVKKVMEYNWQLKQKGAIKFVKSRLIPPSVGESVPASFLSIKPHLGL